MTCDLYGAFVLIIVMGMVNVMVTVLAVGWLTWIVRDVQFQVERIPPKGPS